MKRSWIAFLSLLAVVVAVPSSHGYTPDPALLDRWKAALRRARDRFEGVGKETPPLPPDPARPLALPLVAALRSGDFAAAEELAAGARRTRDVADQRVLPQVAVLVGEWAGLAPRLAAWKAARPGSALAHYLAGTYDLDSAVRARGTYYAHMLRPRQLAFMERCFASARRDLERARALDAGLCEASVALMNLLRNVGQSEGRWELLEEARAGDPHGIGLHGEWLTGLLTRWGGNDDDLKPYLRYVMQPEAPPSSEVLPFLVRSYFDSGVLPGETAAEASESEITGACRLLEHLPAWNWTWDIQARLARKWLPDQDLREVIDLRSAATVRTDAARTLAMYWIRLKDPVRKAWGAAWLRELARLGYPRARYNFAKVKIENSPEGADLAEPLGRIEVAAGDGSREAMAFLAMEYGTGPTSTRDPARGLKWALRAAEAFDDDGLRCLGILQLLGWGTTRDPAEGIENLMTAGALGDSDALKFLDGLSELLLDPGASGENAEAARPLFKESTTWLGDAALARSVGEAQLWRAMAHLEGRPLDPDALACFRGHYDRAFRLGVREAALVLGGYLDSGQVGPPDPRGACQWYRKAPELVPPERLELCR